MTTNHSTTTNGPGGRHGPDYNNDGSLPALTWRHTANPSLVAQAYMQAQTFGTGDAELADGPGEVIEETRNTLPQDRADTLSAKDIAALVAIAGVVLAWLAFLAYVVATTIHYLMAAK